MRFTAFGTKTPAGSGRAFFDQWAAKTRPKLVRKIVSLRRRKRPGQVEIGDALRISPSTVHAVLRRVGSAGHPMWTG